MTRIKVISDPSELVAVFRAVDSEVKREVFKELTLGWKTGKEIEEKYGPEGRKALVLLEKLKLVETTWQRVEGSPKPLKAYHTYYSSFNINVASPVPEICDVLWASVIPDKEFKKYEDKILKLLDEAGTYVGDIVEKLGVSQTMLKSLVRRSTKLEYRGQRVDRLKEE